LIAADPLAIFIGVFTIRRRTRELPFISRETVRFGDFGTDFDPRTTDEAIFPAE